MGAACLCAYRQVVQLHRRWMAQTKASPSPLCKSEAKTMMLHVWPQIEANELIHNKMSHKKQTSGLYSFVTLVQRALTQRKVVINETRPLDYFHIFNVNVL